MLITERHLQCDKCGKELHERDLPEDGEEVLSDSIFRTEAQRLGWRRVMQHSGGKYTALGRYQQDYCPNCYAIVMAKANNPDLRNWEKAEQTGCPDLRAFTVWDEEGQIILRKLIAKGAVPCLTCDITRHPKCVNRKDTDFHAILIIEK